MEPLDLEHVHRQVADALEGHSGQSACGGGESVTKGHIRIAVTTQGIQCRQPGNRPRKFFHHVVRHRFSGGGLVKAPAKLRRDIVGVRFRRDASYALGTLRCLRFRAVRLCSSSPRLDAARFDRPIRRGSRCGFSGNGQAVMEGAGHGGTSDGDAAPACRSAPQGCTPAKGCGPVLPVERMDAAGRLAAARSGLCRRQGAREGRRTVDPRPRAGTKRRRRGSRSGQHAMADA